MEKLILIGIVILLLSVSVPLHEFFHILAVKCLGGKGKLKVFWFSFNQSGIEGSVEGEKGTFNFPKLARWKKRYRLVGFCLGLSGGSGTAVLLAGIGVFFLLNPLDGIFASIWKPFFLVAGIHLLKGILEAVQVFKQIKLVKD